MGTWWIDRDSLLGSANPTTRELESLYGLGFKTVISLLDEEEQRPRYDKELAKEIGFELHSVPVRDCTAPSVDQYRAFYEIVRAALQRGKVVVHCEGGSGRTGTMGAAYLVLREGLSAGDAIESMRAANPHAVETSAQCASLSSLEQTLSAEGTLD